MSKLMRPAGQSAGVVRIPDAPAPVKPKDPAVQGLQDHRQQAAQDAEVQQLYANTMQRAKEDGERMAQKMMLHARKERGELLAQAQREAQALKEAARAEGYAAGVDEKSAKIETALSGLAEDVRRMRTEQEAFFAELTAKVQEFALEVAGHLMSHTLEKDELVLKDLTDAALEGVKDTAWVTLEISEKMPTLVSLLEKEYAKSRPGRARIEVRARDLPPDAVILNTPDGLVDATLSRQLENLREGFERTRLQADKTAKS